MMLLDTIVQADALEFMRGLEDDSIDMILTSPPYDNLREYNGYSWDFEGIAQQSYRVLKPGGVMVWVVGDATIDGSETLASFKQAIYFKEACGFNVHDTMIYQKKGVSFPDTTRYYQQFEYMFIMSKGKPKSIHLQQKRNRWGGTSSWGSVTKRDAGSQLICKGPKIVNEFGIMGNVWDFHAGNGFGQSDKLAYKHPATFPETLAERHIKTWSNPGDIVLDFFMGSGTTAKMAMKLDRHYIGCDSSQEYVDLATRRIQNSDPFQDSVKADGATQLSLFADGDR